MYITMRAIWPMLAGIVAVIAVPHLSTALAWSVACLLLIVFDAVLAPHPGKLLVTREVPRTVRLGESVTCTVSVVNSSSRLVRLSLRDAWSPATGASGVVGSLEIPAGQRRRHSTTLTPKRRGDSVADLVTLRSLGPLGLAGRQLSVQAPARLRVLPPFLSRRHLPSRLARLREMDGRSAVMVRGAGTEFDSLREYVMGDDVRSIDWQSTARRGEVLVRTWRPERDRRILIVLDSGRLAAARVGDYPRMDAQIEACLLLAVLASRAGDRVDVVAVDEYVRAQVHGVGGDALISTIADRLAPAHPHLAETNWGMVASLAQQTLQQRALVVVLSSLDGAGIDATRLRTLASLASQHTVLIASATDPSLSDLQHDRSSVAATYVAAAAERDRLEHESVRTSLTRAGIRVIEAPADGLAPALADAYLDLKAAGRL